MGEENKGLDRGYHHGDLKAALLSAAKRLLEEHGPEAISFREIARQAGVSRTAPYNHFQNKEHLLANVAIEGFHDFISFLNSKCEKDAKPEQKIFDLFQAYVIFARSRPQLYRLMFGVGVADWNIYPDVKEAAKKSYEPMINEILTYYADKYENNAGIVETAARVVWSILHGFSMLVLDEKLNPENAEDTAHRLASWFIASLDAGADDFIRS